LELFFYWPDGGAAITLPLIRHRPEVLGAGDAAGRCQVAAHKKQEDNRKITKVRKKNKRKTLKQNNGKEGR